VRPRRLVARLGPDRRATPRLWAFGLIATLAVASGTLAFLLTDRDRTLRLSGQTLHLVLQIERSDDFSFDTDAATVLIPAASPARPGTTRVLKGRLQLEGPTEVEMTVDPARGSLSMTLRSDIAARPRIGDDDVPYGSAIFLSLAEMRRISVLRASGAVTLGKAARSNSMAHLLEADYLFFERVPGLGEVAMLQGALGRFDVVTVRDARSGLPARSDVLIDLSASPLRVWIEAGAQGIAPVLSVERTFGVAPAVIGPGWLDRLLANPLFNLATGVLSFVLLFGQLLSLLPVRHTADPAALPLPVSPAAAQRARTQNPGGKRARQPAQQD